MSGALPDPFGTGIIGGAIAPRDSGGRRKLHRLTPVVHALRAGGILFAIGLGLVSQNPGEPLVLAFLVGAAALVVLTVFAFQYLSWRRLSYWFDTDGDLRVQSGVLTHQTRRLQLSRLQAVDVVAPLVARFVGLAEVRVDVAGTGESKVALQYLTRAEADALRNEILARAAGIAHDTAEAPETVLVTVSPSDLLVSLALRGSTAFLAIVTVLVVVVTVVTVGPLALGLLVVGGVPIFAVFGEFAKFYGFALAESPDGLRLRHGLLQTESQTVPPGRVQAVELVQPLLWRRRGWVRVNVNIAGGRTGDDQHTGSVLLPVAPWAVARDVLRRLLPDVDLDAIDLHPAPTRARWRAPVQHARLAVGWSDAAFLVRRGRLDRRWAVILHARTQSVRVTQGPWQRRLALADVHIDSTPGPVRIVARHRDESSARLLASAQADRAAAARRGDLPARWAAPPGTTAPTTGQSETSGSSSAS